MQTFVTKTTKMKFQFLLENTVNNTLGTVSKFCPNGIVINMVVGGEVVTLKSIEESSTIVMQEMPMQILDFMKTILLLAFVNG
ncbi:hypothetical protein D0Y65_029077 [Glycine soja]|uniref:Uncharacterized protein n=1 Tax=Glycine soja TaxID=3848 RepID=A0A445HXH7_GLYSO|nr:hypothetical protein D0Y65_029077 [Glycine soja]